VKYADDVISKNTLLSQNVVGRLRDYCDFYF